MPSILKLRGLSRNERKEHSVFALHPFDTGISSYGMYCSDSAALSYVLNVVTEVGVTVSS